MKGGEKHTLTHKKMELVVMPSRTPTASATPVCDRYFSPPGHARCPRHATGRGGNRRRGRGRRNVRGRGEDLMSQLQDLLLVGSRVLLLCHGSKEHPRLFRRQRQDFRAHVQDAKQLGVCVWGGNDDHGQRREERPQKNKAQKKRETAHWTAASAGPWPGRPAR